MCEEHVELSTYDFEEIWSRAPEGLSIYDHCELVNSYAICPEGYYSLAAAGIYQKSMNEYWSFSAWADTTGWGCQDGVDWYGPFPSVMAAANALTQEDRVHLGFQHSPVPEDIYRDYQS